jgi:hypothetical protein
MLRSGIRFFGAGAYMGIEIDRRSCALRAPTVFSARIKAIRAENTVMQ